MQLANLFFAYELQRRLGEYGVQSCAVDPGAVNTNIWQASRLSRDGPISSFINAVRHEKRCALMCTAHPDPLPG